VRVFFVLLDPPAKIQLKLVLNLFKQIHIGLSWGGMNSWFLYEVKVFSMGPILANIRNNLGTFDYAVSIMVSRSGITVPGP
jgi:hypothetical protein